MDYDLSRMACRPEDPTMLHGLQVIADCFERSGKHADCGLRLASYLADAGLPPPAGSKVDTYYTSIKNRGPMVRAVISSLVPAAAALGIATAAELAQLQERIVALEAANQHFVLGPLMIGVWTTVPG